MKFEQTMNKVFTNTYVLYGLFGYSVVTILGYLFTQNVDAIVVFTLVGMIAINFSRNMAVVMFICLTTVHLLMPNFKLVNKVHEGMKSMGKTDETTTDEATTDETTTSSSDEDKKKKMMMKKKMSDSSSGTSSGTSSGKSSSKLPTTTDESSTAGFRPMEEKEGRDKLNYGASIHNAYQDLNSILDGDAIKSLTSETMALMEEQKKLADSLSTMGPFMEQAQNLLSNFNKNK
jgi:hypothetical protein